MIAIIKDIATKNVLRYPDQALKMRSREVEEVTKEIKKLCLEMIETIKDADGVGLAAPQVGVLKRLIAVDIGKKPFALINPVITKKSKETFVGEEGCLSFPKVFIAINRATEIEVEALNIDGKPIKLKAKDFAARVLQHEIDHLNGILIIDKVGFLKRLKIKKAMKKGESIYS